MSSAGFETYRAAQFARPGEGKRRNALSAAVSIRPVTTPRFATGVQPCAVENSTESGRHSVERGLHPNGVEPDAE